MPSSASVAIREEQAIERIKAATLNLRKVYGDKLPEYSVGEVRVHPMERQALTLEWCAGLLETLGASFAPGEAIQGTEEETVELEVAPESVAEDGDDHENTGGELTTRITPNSLRRSKSKRS